VDENALQGGLVNAGRVTRRGDVVRRPAPPHAAALHAYFAELRDAGFDGVPRAFSLSAGYEELEFVHGEVALTPYPDWALGENALAEAGRLLRRMHDASAAVPLPQGSDWPTEFADPEGGSVLCHNDFCPENVVFRDGKAIAAIDFDFAAPGRPLWDVAFAAWYWVPTLPPRAAEAEGMAGLDPARRLRVFADACGLDAAERPALLELLPAVVEANRRFVDGRVAAGDPVFTRLDGERDSGRWDDCLGWLDACRADLLSALMR
jgi:aminoglycoside phosphotransferase (APT) family kinase protein